MAELKGNGEFRRELQTLFRRNSDVMNTPVFSADWSETRTYWGYFFKTYTDFIGRKDLRFLEIGCFEGMATLWFLEEVLTHKTARITVVDTFEGAPEIAALGLEFVTDLQEKFERNIRPYKEKVNIWRGRSQTLLRTLPKEFYDCVYIDGSHTTPDVLADAIYAWELLKFEGVMIFDDYLWGEGANPMLTPKVGVNAFLSYRDGEFEPLYTGGQVAIRKTLRVKVG